MGIRPRLLWECVLATVCATGCCETLRCWRMNHPILGRLPPRPAPVITEPTVPAPPGQSLYPVVPNGRCCSPVTVPNSGTLYPQVPAGTYIPAPQNGSRAPLPSTPGTSYYAPLPGANWRAAPGTSTLPPQPVLPADHRGAIPVSPAAFPADIARWQVPYEGVASGLYPQPGGWDWLTHQGYRTVLHIKAAGEDEASIRSEGERRGMRYIALEVSPQLLNRDLVMRFSTLLADRSLHRIFVTDKDGTLAGAIWYLHYRLTEKLDDTEAKRRAAQHGFTENDSRPEVTALWLAVQNVLKSP